MLGFALRYSAVVLWGLKKEGNVFKTTLTNFILKKALIGSLSKSENDGEENIAKVIGLNKPKNCELTCTTHFSVHVRHCATTT